MRIRQILVCLLMITLLNNVSKPISFAPVEARSLDGIVLGGFDLERGEGNSFEFGDFFEQARASLNSNFPEISFTSFRELTTTSVITANILLLSTSKSNFTIISPLSQSEQTVLFDFVQSGGCVILLPDNDAFAGLDEANESFVDKFGMDMSGTLNGKVTTTITNSSFSTITNGPYGVITSFSQNYPGGITNTGQYGIPLSANSLGDSLVMIPRDAIQSGSGQVVIFSDANTFADDENLSFFSENESLFLNTIFSCIADQNVFLPIVSR